MQGYKLGEERGAAKQSEKMQQVIQKESHKAV